MSKYSLYIKEREGLETYEDDKGFFTYKVENPNIFCVADLFILPEFRNNGIGKEFSRKIDDLAKEHNCCSIFVTTCKDANGWERSDRYIQTNGYKEIFKINSMIYYKKEL